VNEDKNTTLNKISSYLKVHGHITPVLARTVFHVERLAARIHELRAWYGMDISTKRVQDEAGKTYTRYVLA
jgi:hypothetical protein